MVSDKERGEGLREMGRELRRLREQEKHWTQATLAGYIGVSRSWVAGLELGNVTGPEGPNVAAVLKAAQLLGADLGAVCRALGVSPEVALAVEGGVLAPDVLELAAWMHKLAPAERYAVLLMVNAIRDAVDVLNRGSVGSGSADAQPPTPLPRRRLKPPVH